MEDITLKRRTKEEYEAYMQGYQAGLDDGENKSPEFRKAMRELTLGYRPKEKYRHVLTNSNIGD